MIKRKNIFKSLVPLTTIAIPIVVVTSCGHNEEVDKDFSFSGNIYQANSHQLTSNFVRSLTDFRRAKIKEWNSNGDISAVAEGIGDIFKTPNDNSEALEVSYDLSSLDLDYFSPKIFEYMNFGEIDVRINLILDNNKLKGFDFNTIPPTISSISLNNNSFVGKFDISFIKNIHPIFINLNNNKITSISYTEIKEYIKSYNHQSKLTSINVVSDFKNNLFWESKDARSSFSKKFWLSIRKNNINKLEFEKNIKSIEALK
ncbi:MAG: hypothetical protein HRT98_03330 [Mycoplasmatales bacterium]|nr:hypothetical protein [Mycoplasmatales bacterium]